MKSPIYLLAFFLCITNIWGQKEPYYKTYDWEDNPIANIDIEKFQDKDIVAFKDKTVNEFYFLNKDSFVEYSLIHKLYWLNSNDNIEKYNKVYLPSSSNSEVVKNKARVITKDGKVIELDDSKILTSTDEETKRTLKYYALEGIEKGGYIEYFFVVKRYPTYTGNRITLQSDFDKKNVDFELLAPSNLIFQIKTYNNLPEAVKDSTNKDKNHWKLQLKEIGALEKEEQAPYSAISKYLVYKLKQNTNNPENDIVSYRAGSQNIYKNLYNEVDSKLNNKIKKFLKSIAGIDSKNITTKIRSIENYIKANIYVGDISREDLEDISSILDNKVANERGIVKLYLTLFNALEIKHQIVYTTDRREMKFDKNFEAYNFLQENLIYFPKNKLYMAPTKLDSRLGFPPGYLTDNYGLFIKQVTLGGFTSGVGSIKYIKPVNYDKTNYDLVMNVSFDSNDLTTTKLKMDRTMDGYYAVYVQPFMDIAKEENKNEMIDGVIKSINPNLDIIEKKVLNASAKDFGNKPLQIIAELKSEDYVDKAGNKYLFKIGNIIGPQQEMYQEKTRQLPVENEFERSYDRKIIVDIPEGYQFKNLDKINIDESYSMDNKELFMFKSSYELNDNQLVVSIKEYYNQNIIDFSLYEEYRTVINSAANFNKVTLILEKI
ncbi:DUF3857 domain-containing protein [Aquimarina sp. MMG016]|uniref:DUF3857 domain-containing protein n=1 Tax=Aquimarina sp. MMG016 TaxID=2822690 RepID=UPI001B3A32DA|nr:DUF3857 domain-containing protein [Aquimarina sp. MMG016]MBQ4822462.1 DUF3857 domain-containing protein [Aquimarina sp. MMG016]